MAESERKSVLEDAPLRPRGRARRGSRARRPRSAARGAEGARRACGHPLEERLEREHARQHEVRVERREGRLQAGHAERRLLERDLLLVQRVRRVVGGDARDRAAAERVDERLPIDRGRLSGGFIFTFASSERTASSVRTR